ncbi:MAG: hypothetical protein JSS72_13105 [Armatimonadetes bacterium]|nr:hypothetical protein [Armatimonadota bacterium]
MQTLAYFAIAALAAYCVTQIWQFLQQPKPKVGMNVRLRHRFGFTQCRISAMGGNRWRLEFLDQETSLTAGESMIAEVSLPRGTALFRTAALSLDEGEVIIAAPSQLHARERRQSERIFNLDHLPAKLEGEPAVLKDISRHGARVKVFRLPSKGDRVCLRIDGDLDLMAWVKDINVGNQGPEARLIFEEALHPALLKERFIAAAK